MKNSKKGLKITLAILCTFLLIGTISAVWVLSAFSRSISANVVGRQTSDMIVLVDLVDFGLVDFSNGVLNRSQEFIVESPNGITEQAYRPFWNITRTELEPSNCTYTEDEVTFEFWKTGGLKTIGQLEYGKWFYTSDNTEDSTYEVRINAISANVCPVDYQINLTFVPN